MTDAEKALKALDKELNIRAEFGVNLLSAADLLGCVHAETIRKALQRVDKVQGLVNGITDAMNSLTEINPSNYTHDDVCHLSSRSVEAALLLDHILAAFGADDLGVGL